MAVVLPTSDPALVTRFVAGDESALTTLYRQTYDQLLAASGEVLGADLAHFRGRVAENAMLDAWGARSRFESPGALSSYLEEAVKQEAGVQRRKHAALRRHDGQGPSHIAVPSVDEAVNHLVETLRAPAADHEALLAEAREVKKAHTREHVQRVGSRPKWVVPTLLGVAAVAVIILGQRYLDKAGVEAAVDRSFKGENVQTLSAAKGQRGSLTLRDGTKAAIGSDSKLRIPEEFATTQRTIALEGTATFTVTPSSDPQAKAFAVRAGGTTFTATGTVFTLRNFEEDQAIFLQVTDGTVDVTDRERGTTQQVKAGSAIRVGTDGAITPLTGGALDVAMAWTRDTLVFENQPLKTVIPELVRWFSLNAILADESIGDRPVTMRVALSSSGDATKVLTEAANLAIQFGKDDRIEFNDGGVVVPKK
jgi:transmembrane sensor